MTLRYWHFVCNLQKANILSWLIIPLLHVNISHVMQLCFMKWCPFSWWPIGLVSHMISHCDFGYKCIWKKRECKPQCFTSFPSFRGFSFLPTCTLYGNGVCCICIPPIYFSGLYCVHSRLLCQLFTFSFKPCVMCWSFIANQSGRI